jgi:hypothetical protein
MALIGNMTRLMHRNTDRTKQDETKINMNNEVIKNFQFLSIVYQLHF